MMTTLALHAKTICEVEVPTHAEAQVLVPYWHRVSLSVDEEGSGAS